MCDHILRGAAILIAYRCFFAESTSVNDCRSQIFRGRPGFTITELLVVISIIAILAGLLIPAVNAARESARKTTCANNVRNIGLAVLNFETRYQKFPPAATASPKHSVFVYLLPFFEEGALYNKLDIQKDWDSSANVNWEQDFSLGGLLICPSAPETRTRVLGGEERTEHISQLQVSDYAPVSSLRADSGQPSHQYNGLQIHPLRQLLDAGKIKTNVRGNLGSPVPPRWQGLLQVSETLKSAAIRNADVRDGLSTTMLFFEAAGRPEHNANHRRVQIRNPGDEPAEPITSFRWAGTAIPVTIHAYCREGSMMNCENSDELYSFHNGGSNIAFADGSMHFIREDIDPETFVSLYTMAGGDVVSEQAAGL